MITSPSEDKEKKKMDSFTLTDKGILYYHFTPEEVHALYRLIEHEFTPRDDKEIVQVINHITSIVRANELATRDSKTT